jgi:hypothetical protein
MPVKTPTAMRLDPAVLDAMRRYKDAEGVPLAVQIEKAVTEWLSKRGVVVKADRSTRGKRGSKS